MAHSGSKPNCLFPWHFYGRGEGQFVCFRGVSSSLSGKPVLCAPNAPLLSDGMISHRAPKGHRCVWLSPELKGPRAGALLWLFTCAGCPFPSYSWEVIPPLTGHRHAHSLTHIHTQPQTTPALFHLVTLLTPVVHSLQEWSLRFNRMISLKQSDSWWVNDCSLCLCLELLWKVYCMTALLSPMLSCFICVQICCLWQEQETCNAIWLSNECVC